MARQLESYSGGKSLNQQVPEPLIQNGEPMSKIKANSASRARVILVTFVLALAPGWLGAGQAEIDQEAVKLLKNSMDYLAALQQFELEAHSTIEVVLETGQKLQFHHTNVLTVQRPNTLHARRLGDLADQEFFYDGETLTLYFPAAGYYAKLKAPDTLEGMLDFATESLDIVAPAGEFIYSNGFDILMEGVQSGFVVPMQSFVEGAICDHLAFSAPGTDFQVWVQQGDQPLPRKLVITSRDVLNAPQFVVRIRNWNLNPEVSAEQFQAQPSEDATKIEFIIREVEGN